MAEDAQATPDSKMEEMKEAQILEEMATKQGDAEVQFLGFNTLRKRVWPANIALKPKRDREGQMIGTVDNPISPWPEVINAVVCAMETHPDNVIVTESACAALLFYYEEVCTYDTVSSQRPASTMSPRVIKAVIASLRREKAEVHDDADIKAMRVLWTMTPVRTTLQDIMDAEGIDVLQSVLLRHPSNRYIIERAYALFDHIARNFAMELAVSSSMLESLRQVIQYERPAGMIILTMTHITDAPPADWAEADAADFLKHTQNNITALRPGVGWILATMQIHMKSIHVVVFSLKLLTNMAQNAGSKDMAQCINKGLGFNMVLEIMKYFPMNHEPQLHCAKAIWALLFVGGVETVEEDGKRRANQMLRAATARFNAPGQLELRTVAKKVRELINLDPIEVDDM